jgi:hypothetical protein
MANRKADQLKKLIQKVELDTPSLNFTDLVMEEVAAQEPVVNPALKVLLKRNGMEHPSLDFTQGILTQLEARDLRKSHQPIIPQRAWLIINCVIVSLVVYLGFSEQSSNSTDGLTPYLISMGNLLNTVFTSIESLPSLYLITFISASALLVIDYLIKKRMAKS